MPAKAGIQRQPAMRRPWTPAFAGVTMQKNHAEPKGNRPMAQTAPTNVKKLLLPTTLAKAGWAIVEAREDVEGVPYDVTGSKAELHRLLEDCAGVALSVQPFSDPELDAGSNLEVVARIGVGYDAVDVPA